MPAMPDYLIVEYPDGAQYAVHADRAHTHPGAKVIGKEQPTGVTQLLPAEDAPVAKPTKAAPTS
jgi:hypothetical protein